MKDEAAELCQFEPGVYVMLDDVMTGVRKLVRVTESGHGYIDLDDDDATPFPIYKALNPEEVGNILGWGLYLADKEPQHSEAFKRLVDGLIHSGEGVLVYNRAAHWGFTHRTFDLARALAEAKAQTAKIAAGRADMDAIIKNGGGGAS